MVIHMSLIHGPISGEVIHRSLVFNEYCQRARSKRETRLYAISRVDVHPIRSSSPWVARFGGGALLGLKVFR